MVNKDSIPEGRWLVKANTFDPHSSAWVNAYTQRRETWSEYNKLMRRERHACELIANEPKGTAMDLGCGVGSTLIKLHRMGFGRVVGIDISEHMLSVARKLVAGSGLSRSIELHNSDVRHLLAIESNSVDVCTALGVIEYFDEDGDLLLEVNRVLKTNGSAVIQTRNRDWLGVATRRLVDSVRPGHRRSQRSPGYREHSPMEFRKSANAYGFTVEQERYSHFQPLYPLRLMPVIRVPIRALDNSLGKQLEWLHSHAVSRYLASMHIVKLRKTTDLRA